MSDECKHRKWLESTLPTMSQLHFVSCPWCSDPKPKPALWEKLKDKNTAGVVCSESLNQYFEKMAAVALAHFEEALDINLLVEKIHKWTAQENRDKCSICEVRAIEFKSWLMERVGGK